MENFAAGETAGEFLEAEGANGETHSFGVRLKRKEILRGGGHVDTMLTRQPQNRLDTVRLSC